jgi:cereblon
LFGFCVHGNFSGIDAKIKCFICINVTCISRLFFSLQCVDIFFWQSLIAKRSDMVVMSTDGPLGAYVNPHGCVHETITVSNATGLALSGSPSTVHSWFPGYKLVLSILSSLLFFCNTTHDIKLAHASSNFVKHDLLLCRYSWTIANCAACESHIGWLFRATKKNLRPRSFWGIRSSQIADDLQVDQNE